MSLFIILHTLISRFLLFCLSFFIAPFILLVACFSVQYRFSSRWIFKIVHGFYQLVRRATLLPIMYSGLEHLPVEPAIFVANHQSSLDIPLLGILAQGHPHIWLARGELMETLVIRWILPIFTIVADVTNIRAAALSLRRIFTVLQTTNAHLMIFPEGSRFDDDQIHPFFNGFVIIAKKMQRPVIPVYIDGLNKVYPRDSWFIRRYPVTVIVGQAMHMRPDESDEHFKERVQSWFFDQLNK